MFHVGDVIEKLRKDRGWTQDDLARKADVSVMTVSEIESGKGNPRLTTLSQIAKAFEVSVEELFALAAPRTATAVNQGERDQLWAWWQRIPAELRAAYAQLIEGSARAQEALDAARARSQAAQPEIEPPPSAPADTHPSPKTKRRR